MTRSNVIITGAVGLLGSLALTAFCVFIVVSGWLPILIQNTTIIWSIFFFLLTISVAEIPLMIYSMRRIAVSSNQKSVYVALLTNIGYTFFAGVYAAPFILLTGKSSLELAAGLLLGGLSLVRFITSLIFLPDDKTLTADRPRPTAVTSDRD